MRQYFSNKSLFSNLSSLGILLYFLLFFSVSKGPRIGIVVIVLTSIIGLSNLIYKKAKFDISKQDKKILFSYIFFGFVILVINLFHLNDSIYLEDGAKLLLVFPIFLFFKKFPISITWFYLCVMLATLIGASFGLYNVINNDVSRATVKGINTIHYASIMQLFAIISLIGLFAGKSIQNKNYRTVYYILGSLSFLSGSILSILSYSRGVWLALPLQLLLVAIYYFKYFKKLTVILGAIFILLIGLLYVLPQTGISARLNRTKKSLNNYNAGNSNTSTGLRLDMYKFAIVNAKQSPIFGASRDKIREEQDKLPLIKHLYHFHNDFLQTLVYYGVIGLVALLSIYLFSFNSFLYRIKNPNYLIRSKGFIGVVLLVSYFIYNLTDLLFANGFGMFLFMILTVLICTSTEREECI